MKSLIGKDIKKGYQTGFQIDGRRFVFSLKDNNVTITEMMDDGSEVELEKDTMYNLASCVAQAYLNSHLSLEKLKYDMGVTMFEFADKESDGLMDIVSGKRVSYQEANNLQEQKKKDFCEKLMNDNIEIHIEY